MEIQAVKENIAVVVSVTGKIDAASAPEFEKSLSGLIARDEKYLLINFSELGYISSAGLRSILFAAKQLKPKGGNIFFCGLKGSVRDVFRISGFGTIFKIFETQEEAMNAIALSDK